MKNSENWLIAGFLMVCLFAMIVANLRVTEFRQAMPYRLQVSAVPVPSEVLKMLAGEFKGMVANYLLLEAASFIGGNVKPEDRDWIAVARLLDYSSILDPYFQQTYILTQGTLPWFAQKYDETLTILERSKHSRDWDWVPGFFIAFNHYYFLQDYKSASEFLMETSRMPDAPPLLATWASRLASKGGHYPAAIAFLTSMYENAEDEKQKEMLQERLQAIQGAYKIQQAVDMFKDRYGNSPRTLDELLANGFLLELPLNPYNRPYKLVDGIVEF